MLDQFLAGTLSFEDLERGYGDYFVDVVPETALPEPIHAFFSDVHERLCFWTTRQPAAEDRQYGWSDVDEFTTWLIVKRATLPS